MLAPEEFTVGSFASAAVGSLILPRTKYEAIVLVGVLQDVATAVFLSEEHQFHCMSTEGAQWAGLIIPNVTVEVDEFSAIDMSSGSAPLGSIVRSADHLAVLAKPERSRWGAEVSLIRNLPAIQSGSVGFTRWQVVLGTGDTKRVLHKVQLPQSS